MMQFIAIAETDIGISRKTNQDSVLIKHAISKYGEVLLAVVCDGMGGLENGELASATVVRAFSEWFDEELPRELETIDMQVIGEKWSLFLKELNVKISEYGQSICVKLGTTFTGILFVGNRYIVGHVGDTRIYRINESLEQITTDQSFVAREVDRGLMTEEQARKDKRRNILLQCVGASARVKPQLICGSAEPGVYMLCSDGFYHHISENEMFEKFNPLCLVDRRMMHSNARFLIEQAKLRKERDNISIILIKITISSEEKSDRSAENRLLILDDIMYINSDEVIKWDEHMENTDWY